MREKRKSTQKKKCTYSNCCELSMKIQYCEKHWLKEEVEGVAEHGEVEERWEEIVGREGGGDNKIN